MKVFTSAHDIKSRAGPYTVIGTRPMARHQSDACAGAWRESDVFGDAGYQGVEASEIRAPADWHIAMKRGKRKALPKDAMGKLMERFENSGQHPCEGQAPVSCSEESLPSTAKRATGSRQNEAQLFSLFGLVNRCSRASDWWPSTPWVRPDAAI